MHSQITLKEEISIGASYPFLDQRFAIALDLLESGQVHLLSVDVFDTLLARCVPRPSDVFLRLGVKLHEEKLLAKGHTADSFAAIRYQTEYATRGDQQRKQGTREVTLAEIYELMPRHIIEAKPADLVKKEIATEHELCFANLDVAYLLHRAKQINIKICLISNTYFSENVLRDLIQEKIPDLPPLDGFFVSCEHRCGKRDGLMKKMIDAFGVHPKECLHIGDDPISDRGVAAGLGIPCVYVGPQEDPLSQNLRDEQPIQWHRRAEHYGDVNGDSGLTWLRRQAEYWPQSGLGFKDKKLYAYGAQMLGPLFTGFSAWAGARLREEKAKVFYGIAREGVFLKELVSAFTPYTNNNILTASRIAAARATFSPQYPEHLEDFFSRRGHWPLALLFEQLGFNRKQTSLICDPKQTLEDVPPQALTEKIIASPLANQLYQQSSEHRGRLMAHLKHIGALENERLFLLDVGYGATIQRALQRIFTIEQIPVTTHGLYLVSAHVSLITQKAGGIVEGFLAQNGNPNDFARAFCRSPEIIELSCMPPYGSVIDYDQNGKPIYTQDTAPPKQHEEISIIQRGIKDFFSSFLKLNESALMATNFCSTSWQKQIRAIAQRLVIYPTRDEVGLVGHWLSDSDAGLASTRPIVSVGSHNHATNTLTAQQLTELPRRDVPWLYGVAATISHSLSRQVGSLMLRKENPSAFADKT